jgi:hypothetical protein
VRVQGFVGYKLNGEIKGIYNEVGSQYNTLGLQVLNKFQIHSNEELQHFFLHRINFSSQGSSGYRFGHSQYWWDDCLRDRTLKMTNGFLFHEKCEIGYVYNLDDDTLDLYRGLFDHPQTKKEQDSLKIKSIFIQPERKSYTHLVYSIKRDEVKQAEKLFINWVTIKMIYKNIYQENKFMKIRDEH